MLAPLFKIDSILDACNRNELVLTANQRLKHKAIDAWGQYQTSLGVSSWRAPRLMTLSQWFVFCWQQLQYQSYEPSQSIIASADQQRIIWEKITANCGLMQTEELAKEAATAFQTLERWLLSTHDLKANHTTSDISSHQQFIDWCKAFEREMEKQGFITQEKSVSIINTAFEHSLLSKEASIHLVGFDDLPPLFNQLILNASDSHKHVDLHSHEPLTRVRTQVNNTENEMLMAVEWAKSILSDKPDARIAIIVPNLGQCRAAIERALVNTFESHSLLAETPRYTYPFNISAGTPLVESPLINDTINLLKLTQKRGAIDEIVQLLFSTFWGKLSRERELRCQLADKLQHLGVFNIDLSELRYWAEKIDSREDDLSDIKSDDIESNDQEQKTGLFNYFFSIKQLEDTNRFKLPSQWVEYFIEHLALLNWPGERQPDSHEYQQIQLWYKLLENLCSLDNTLGSISVNNAIQEIQKMAKHQPFQAQVPDSPIQILGILEGAGLHFSHCWVLGLEQKAWPPAPKPNTLLPLALQREHKMPHASSLRELEFAQSLTHNYFHCADHIVFSSAEYDENNDQVLKPSSLLNALPLREINSGNTTDFENYQNALFQSQELECIDCKTAPNVNNRDYNDKGELPGGVSVIKAQAANPFDAFAKYRLNATKPMEVVNGFSAIETGNILHLAMADIWEQLKSQEALLNLSETQLEELVYSITSQHIAALQKRKAHHLGHTLCELETKRQTQLILSWLVNVEKKRPPFSVVASEESNKITLQGVTFSVRLDRVDQLSDGSYLIIDYKTGKSTINDWLGERPKEPQLPLYLVSSQRSVNGIAFAEINIHKQQFTGLGIGQNQSQYQPINIEGITPIEEDKAIKPEIVWDQAKEQWLNILSTQLTLFLNGDCTVDYRDASVENYNQELRCLNRFYDTKRLAKLNKIKQQN